jgi:hypothetical protein
MFASPDLGGGDPMKRAIVAVLVLTAALGACRREADKAAEAPVASEASTLQIDIGRYSYMLDQTRELTAERTGSAELDPTAPKELARALRETVWEYNLERSQLCARGLFTAVACGPALEPVWMSEPATAEPSLQDLQIRAQSVGDEVMRFWDAVCEDARTRTEDEEARRLVCAIE